jgi:hypothetical protein
LDLQSPPRGADNSSGRHRSSSATDEGARVDFDENVLLASFLFGMVGLGMFMFGKKSGRFVPMGSGLALMAVPYLVTNLLVLLTVGVALLAMPWIVRDA